jgi:hypothetical protein
MLDLVYIIPPADIFKNFVDLRGKGAQGLISGGLPGPAKTGKSCPHCDGTKGLHENDDGNKKRKKNAVS